MTRMQAAPTSGSSAAAARHRGFSILEFMMAIAVLSIIMGALMSFISTMQRRYTSEAKVASVNQVGKTGMDLLAIDVGQAGFPPLVDTTTAQAITASNNAQTVTLASTVGIHAPLAGCEPDAATQLLCKANPTLAICCAGRTVLVDVGTGNQESVTVSACTATPAVIDRTGCLPGSSNTITGVFKKGHANGVPVRASSMPYPQGIIFDVAHFSAPATIPGSNCNRLEILGDLRGDGSLRYVEYLYTPFSGDTPGKLERSDTSAFKDTESPKIIVVDNLWDSTLFNYKVFARSCTGVPACVSCTPEGSSFTYVTQVGVTMTMRTAAAVERGAGGTRTIIFRQQYFTPRNVIYAINLANDGLQTVLPMAPGAVTSYLAK
jgi:prepilin-type N-terminal cleavage/methylation domain-containing protein